MKKNLTILGVLVGILFTSSTLCADPQPTSQTPTPQIPTLQAPTAQTSTTSTTQTAEKKTEEKTFSVDYAPNSPVKDISLKNTKLKGIIYYYGNPQGATEVTTDDNQNFHFKFGDGNETVFSLVGIEGEDKANAACSGNLLPNDTKILVTCKTIRKS